MENVLLDGLPTEWNGYEVNTDFRIGIQLSLLQEDETISDYEKSALAIALLFSDIDGDLRPYPQGEELAECVSWFLGGWHTDNHVSPEEPNKRIIDYDVDSWRIYADFIAIYRIDLSVTDLHFWAFQGLLWNMPADISSFLQCIQIRQKKPGKHTSTEERKAIERGHKLYDLKQRKVQLTDEQNAQIDEFDAFMEEIKKQKGET